MSEVNKGEISENDELLQGAINALTGYIAILDIQGNILKVNQAWRDLAGLNGVNYEIGANYIKACRDLDSGSIGGQLAQGIIDVVNEKKNIFEIEYPFQTPKGQLWYVTRVAPFGKGENLRIIVTHENITNRKFTESALLESEESYRILAQTASDVIIKIDSASTILFINSACERIFGYEPAEMIGQSLTMIIPEHLRLSHQSGIKRYLQTGKKKLTWESLELPALHKDGHIFPLEVSFGEFIQDGNNFFIGVARDITGRINTQETLQQNQMMLSLAMQSSRMGAWERDVATDVVIWSEELEEIFGLRKGDFGQTLDAYNNLVHIDDRARIRGEIEQAISENRDYSIEFRFYHADGSIRWMEGRGQAVYSQKGEPVRLYGIGIDITERKKAEEKLRDSEQQLQTLSDSVPQLVWMAEPNGHRFWFNQRWYDYTGTTFESMKGLGWQSIHNPKYLPRILELWQRSIDTGEPFEMEYPLRGADGVFRWFLTRMIPVRDSEGKIVRWFGTNTDIHESKQTQEKLIAAERRAAEDYQALLSRIVPLAQTFGTAGNLLTIYREVGKFIRASMPCSAFFLSFYEEARSLRIAAFACGTDGEVDVSELPPIKLTDDGGPNSQAIFQQKSIVVNRYMDLMKNRPHVILQEDGIDPNSSLVVPMKVMNRILGTLEVQAYENDAFTNEHIIALEMVANLAAVAIENVRLLEVEAKGRQAAEEANHAKDEFLSVLSHELRTPLNAMLGWTRMMKSGILDETRTIQAIETIERNARLQNNLIEDLLDVSRIISGKMLLENDEVDIVSIVKNVVENSQPAAQDKNIRLLFESDWASKNLTGDSTRLEQIINNLLNNAVKFTPVGGEISVTLTQIGDSIQIKVSDSGIGISPEFLPMIFDRFKQADSTTRRTFSGLGLGLTIVRHLTELHGGKVEVSSRGENLGSTFIVVLPLAPDSDEDIFAPESFIQIPNTSQIKGSKILLVDDDCDGIQPLQILLEIHLADVHCAHSAKEALQKISEHRFDIIVSDIGMPQMDGYELIDQARRLTNGKYFLPAIALTAYASTQDRERALSAGFQTHLSKPIDFEQFLNVINNLLNNHNKK